MATLLQARRPGVAEADAYTLLRRVTFDLTGLPPTEAQIAAFVRDPSDAAYAARVDQLLASPGFGERWGRHWLDVVRFGESSGGGRSLMFPEAWRYRDYVIESFQADRPYDEFLTEQIAGDLMPADSDAVRNRRLIATGFLELGPTNYELQDKELLRMDVIDEQIDTVGRTFMGLTLGCARCHDHKFDPIPTRDYYALAGIFGSTETLVPGNVSGPVKRELAFAETPKQRGYRKRVRQIERELKRGRSTGRKKGESGMQKSLRRELAKLKKLLAAAAPKAMAVREAKRPADGHVHNRGLVRSKGPRVPRGFLSAWGGDKPAIPPGASGRLQLAQWLASPTHPLTARVYVNRVWHHLFGRGIVPTVDNFGRTGAMPRNPELLDGLAARFVASGWSTKKLIRGIVLSALYRQASVGPSGKAGQTGAASKAATGDAPGAVRRRRLDAEAIRDAILLVSGQLDPQRGGSTIRKVATYDYGYQFRTRRRSVYVPRFRAAQLEIFEVFDAPDPSLVTGARNVSIVSTQALFLMNNPWLIEQADHAARRLVAVGPATQPKARIRRAFLWTLGRPPTAAEQDIALRLVRGAEDDAAPARFARLFRTLFACLDFRYLH